MAGQLRITDPQARQLLGEYAFETCRQDIADLLAARVDEIVLGGGDEDEPCPVLEPAGD